jgi:4-amino-4-deoxy-L-arabinose transferase-like glycosyltransferase
MKWNIVFALFSGATILTKSSGGFLALVPPVAILISGKWRLVKNFSFWIAPVIVGLLCAPWFIMTRDFLTKGFEGYMKPGLVVTLMELSKGVLGNLLWITPFVLYGAWVGLRRAHSVSGLVVVCLAQPVALLTFQALAPVDNEPRYLMSLLPPLLILGALGMRRIADSFVVLKPALAINLLIALSVGSFVGRAATDFRATPENPLRPLARFLISGSHKAILVPADIEGSLIAEICSLTRDRQARFLVRPNKLLAHGNWLGTISQPRYESKEEMQHFFDKVPFSLIVVRMDLYPKMPRHAILVRDMVLAFPEHWKNVASFRGFSPSARYEVYEPVNSARFSPDLLKTFLPHPLEHAVSATR